jgi:hypothetical protein
MPFPTALSAPFLVFVNSNSEIEPIVAASPDGRFEIAWESASFSGDVYSVVYQGGAIGVGGVGSIGGLGITTAAEERNPDAAFLTSGSHVVAFEQVVAGNRDIYMRLDVKNPDASYSLGAVALVNTGGTTGLQFRPEVIGLTGGGFVVTWEDFSDTAIKLQRYDAGGVAQGGVLSAPVLGNQAGGIYHFDLTEITNGGFAIAYRGSGGDTTSKVGAWYANGGSTVTALDVSAQAVGSAHGAVSIAQGPSGAVLVAWRDGDGGGVGYRMFTSGFVAVGGDRLILTAGLAGGNGEYPRVAAAFDGRFMVVFSNSSDATGGVYGQMINADGSLDGAATLISANTNSSGQPEIERTADGRMVVSWQQSGDIYASVYDTRTAGLNLVGTAGADNYVGSDFYNDTIFGAGGADTIYGGNGQDQLAGGNGNDLLEGSFGSDTLFGGNGNDRLFAATADDPNASTVGDLMLGETGNDTMQGSSYNDSLNGGGGRDAAVFTVASTEATFSRGAAWSWNVATGGVTNGTDNLIGVEVAQFTDSNVALREAARSDVSGDGTSDLVFYNAALGRLSYYEVNPAGGYTWRNIGDSAAGFTPSTGDFNGDGEADVIWFNGTTLGYMDVNTGGGGYAWRDIGSVGAGYKPIVGDFDGDGTSDIAFLNQTTGGLSWYDVDPAGGYAWKNIGVVSLGFTPITGDFNGDGKTDIGWFNGATLGYLEVGAAPGYVWKPIGSVGTGHTALAGDFNNDGTTDVAFINQTTNAISFYAVNPNGGYTWYSIGFVSPGYTASAADVNNDGKTDIVFTGFGSVSYYDIGPTGGYTWNNIGSVGAGYLLVA